MIAPIQDVRYRLRTLRKSPVRLVDNFSGASLHDVGMSVPELWDLQDCSGIFEDVSAVWPIGANVTGTEHPERIELLAVSPNYFPLLGVHARLCRVFGPEDKAQDFAESAILSDGVWRWSFDGDPHVLGQRVRADGDAYTIAGVMPPGFRHPAAPWLRTSICGRTPDSPRRPFRLRRGIAPIFCRAPSRG
ncbi:MAG: ABC transporter permease [Bryobacteraceae bacterium]|jgi:hypothetical protein